MLTRKPLRGILCHICLSGPQAFTQSNKHFLKHASYPYLTSLEFLIFFLNKKNSTDADIEHTDGN